MTNIYKKYIGIVAVVIILAAAGYLLWNTRVGTLSQFRENSQNNSYLENSGNGNSGTSPGTPGISAKKIRVISPNGGEVWQRGKQYNVRWDTTLSAAATVYVDIFPTSFIITDPYAVRPSRISGQEMFHSSIFPDGLPNEGSFTYKVPDNLKPGTYQILIWAGKNCNTIQTRCDFDLSDDLIIIR